MMTPEAPRPSDRGWGGGGVTVGMLTVILKLLAGDGRHAADAEALLNRELGQGLYPPGRLALDAADPTAAVWIAIDTAPPPVGAAVARLLIPEDAAYYERFGLDAVKLFAGTVGSYEAVAVAPGFRRMGTGRLLTEAGLGWMRERGCDVAVTLAWLSGRKDSSPHLFRRLGFRELGTAERFYYAESLRDGWECPVCRGPCCCSATLFTLHL